MYVCVCVCLCVTHTQTHTFRDDEPHQYLFNRDIGRHHIHVQIMQVTHTRTPIKRDARTQTHTLGNTKSLDQTCSKMKRNGVLIDTVIYMKLDSIMLDERSHTKNVTYHIIPFI